MNTHTPGPWTIDPNGELPDRPFMVGRTLYCVADVGNEADAKLIAASPTLLSDLQDLVEACQSALPYNHPALVNARAAIAKATNA